MSVVLRPFLAVSLVLSTFGFSPAAQAETSATVSQALEKINLSARQRMLAQRMAGLSCLVHLGIDAEVHAAEALETQALFGDSLAELQANETNPDLLETMAELQTPYNVIVGYMTVLTTTGDMGPRRLEAVATTSEELFTLSNTLTSQVQSAESKNLEGLTLLQTMILNLSGRQRMLSEEAFKEFCLAQAGIEPAHNLELLATTATVFDNTMNALVNGMPGLIIAPPTPEIKAKLEEAAAVWQPVKALLARAVAGETFDTEGVHYVTEELETVRMLMDDAVELYEHYNDGNS